MQIERNKAGTVKCTSKNGAILVSHTVEANLLLELLITLHKIEGRLDSDIVPDIPVQYINLDKQGGT